MIDIHNINNNCIDFNVNKIDNDLPCFKHDFGDAGYDLYVTKTKWIFPFKITKVPVNLKCEIPNYNFGLVTSRSGQTLKGNVVVSGIIDSSYRGQISALAYRIGLLPKRIKKGTRIAQLIIISHKELSINIKNEALSDTKRGKKGFGSSGEK